MRISAVSIGSAAAVGVVLLGGAAPALAAEGSASAQSGTHSAASATGAGKAGVGKAGADKAGVSKAKKLKRLKALTQPQAESAASWRYARSAAKAGHDKYRFNWTTDWCTNLKDKPGGFDFRLSCARHDFGYRNYKALIGKKAFAGSAHERRVDRTFLYDMRQQCEKQPGKTKAQRAKCLKVAQSYYNRVS